MRVRKAFLSSYLLFILLISGFNVNSQSLVNSTGNTISNNSFHFEYSIGEINITTFTSSSNNISQGLLQPNIKNIPPVCDVLNDGVISFENPTKNIIRIVGRYDWITHYSVYAADGKLLKQGNFYNNHIDLTRFPAAIYFIRLYPGCEGKYKVFKVLKQL